MTSQDKEYFTIYFDSITGRLTRIEDRMTKLEDRSEALGDRMTKLEDRITQQESAINKIQSEQQIIINRLDIQDRLIWGGMGYITLLLTLLMFLQGLFKREKVSSDKENARPVFTLDAIKELLTFIKHE